MRSRTFAPRRRVVAHALGMKMRTLFLAAGVLLSARLGWAQQAAPSASGSAQAVCQRPRRVGPASCGAPRRRIDHWSRVASRAPTAVA